MRFIYYCYDFFERDLVMYFFSEFFDRNERKIYNKKILAKNQQDNFYNRKKNTPSVITDSHI